MNGMLILLIAHYEGKLLCRNFIFLLLCGFMLLGITVFHVFLQSDWRVFEYTVNLPSGMPYANAYLWGIMQSFLVIFVVGDFVYRDNIEKTNDVFLARDFSNLEYLTGKLVGVVVAFLVLNVISMFICMLIHLFASSFKFRTLPFLFIDSFFTGLIIHVRFGFHDENMDKIPFFCFYGTGDILSSFPFCLFNKSLGCI